MFSVVFALLIVAAGCAAIRALGLWRQPLGLAMSPVAGLAVLPILTTWSVTLGLAPWLRTGLVLLVALIGIGVAVRSSSRIRTWGRWPTVLVLGGIGIAGLLVGLTLGTLEVPTNRDGFFHVEAVHTLRAGPLGTSMWYPMGFHTSAAAALGVVPWLDSARGTSEAGQALALLAPAVVFAFGLAVGLRPQVAAIGAFIQALTFLYPYDYQLWGGWPLGMGVLLLLGVWSIAVRWADQPSARWALLGGLLLGAIVLTHGTELYSAALGLAVIAIVRARRLDVRHLPGHAGLAACVAAVVALPYLPTLLGWAQAGAAFDHGMAELVGTRVYPELKPPLSIMEWAVALTGAAAAPDLVIRLGAIALGVRFRVAHLLLAMWAAFAVVVVVVDVVPSGALDWLFASTFPWLAGRRPLQLAVILANLIAAIGIAAGAVYLQQWLRQLRSRPNLARRLATACVIVLAFFAEGSGVGIYKRLVNELDVNYIYSADDRAAMLWLRQNARPGEVLANDGVVDSGIWAPYKAEMPVLLPRNAPVGFAAEREPIVESVLELDSRPDIAATACALNVQYVYRGARDHPHHPRMLPPHDALEQDPNLREVFRSGDVAVFKIDLPCT